MNEVIEATDRLNEILNNYGSIDSVQDLDTWLLADVQDCLVIFDNEVARRCNEELENGGFVAN